MTATLGPAAVRPAPARTAPADRDARVPRAGVTDMARSLDFYLRLGCDVVRAADGWVLLRCHAVTFVLVQAGRRAPSAGPAAEDPWIRLGARDVRALRRRLLGEGVPVPPACTPTGRIVVRDPDGRPVAVERLP
ncbi:hypothetical protein GCM10017691_36190 [Pseudonocardia petroleophila]|uniref:VOC family protein n=1 Tax=Pseudonocardia petroleophila TaxID=37331 RepID=A0A7G7MCV7_9PSEU|nr:VOC family protein [Pseudonocardia petroleophila]QNG50618.1 VOC family protein [Pseudonocardia petroleophila]